MTRTTTPRTPQDIRAVREHMAWIGKIGRALGIAGIAINVITIVVITVFMLWISSQGTANAAEHTGMSTGSIVMMIGIWTVGSAVFWVVVFWLARRIWASMTESRVNWRQRVARPGTW